MFKTITQLDEIKLIGITCRTNNAHVFKSDPSTNPIALAVQKYVHEHLAEKINDRSAPGITYCVYTQYESDVNGEYTYFIGEEVSSFEKRPEGFQTLLIPAQTYAKFTNEPGPMPQVCIEMWNNIWTMTDSDLGGQRAYIADMEVYDERSHDHQNVTLDIYIGIKR
jgi:predicted transcriptional regulator YdeE